MAKKLYLSKVLKINNICDNDNLEDCGIVKTFTNANGATKSFPTTTHEVGWHLVNQTNEYSIPETKAAAFETQNGESVAVFYNPHCLTNAGSMEVPSYVCANFVYDLNGNKGPNTFGKDMGYITALYPTDTAVVAPMPLATDAGVAAFKDASAKCTAQDPDSRLPNIEELIAMYFNHIFIPLGEYDEGGTLVPDDYLSSGSYIGADGVRYGYVFLNEKGRFRPISGNEDANIRCIKR